MINFNSIRHNITIIAAVEASLAVSDRLGILRWQKVAKKFPYLTILLLQRRHSGSETVSSVDMRGAPESLGQGWQLSVSE